MRGEISCSHLAAGNTHWKQGLPYTDTLSAQQRIYTHLPPLNSPPVFKIPWLCVFRPGACATLFPSPIITLSAHSAPNNTVLANLLDLVFFTLFETNSSGTFLCAASAARFLLVASRLSLICDLRVYLNKITLTSLAGVICARLCGSAVLRGLLWIYIYLVLCCAPTMSWVRSLGGLAFMRNEKQLRLLLFVYNAVCLRRVAYSAD